METHARYREDLGRTIAIFVDGKQRWISPPQLHAILKSHRMGSASFEEILGGKPSGEIRELELFEPSPFAYVLRVNGCGIYNLLSLHTSALCLSDAARAYSEDPRWRRL